MIFRLLFLILASIALVTCSPNRRSETTVPQPAQQTVPATAALANPATAYCQAKGHMWELREGDGGSYGVCIFAGGSECDEWAYFLGECQPGNVLGVPTTPPEVTPAAVTAEEGWQLYENETPAYSFQFSDAAVNNCLEAVPGAHALLDTAQGICFLYPDTFDVFQGEDGSLTLYERSLLNTEAPLATIHTEAAKSRSLAEVTALRLADYAFPGTEPQSVTLGGQPATMLDNLPGQDTNRRVIAVYEDRVYDLMVARTGSGYGAVGEEAAALYDMVVKTFQFVEVEPDAPLRAGPECPEAESGTILLRDDEGGYCLLLPEGYTVDDSLTSDDGGVKTAVYQGSPLDAAHARLFITVEDAQGQTLQEITQAQELEIESALPGYDLLWSAGLMLDGEWTNELAQVPGQDLSRQLLLLHNGRLYTFSFTPDDPQAGEAYAEMQILYETVIDSFNFLRQ